jgi:hypothetical protein
MKHKVKVVILPTEDYILRGVLKGNAHGRLVINMSRNLPQKFRKTFTPQHLYLTVSQEVEPIKEGDWQIHKSMDLISGYVISQHSIGKSTGRKIIATDDLKLTQTLCYCEGTGFDKRSVCRSCSGRGYRYLVPQVNQSFLKELVVNPDGEWEIEYVYDVDILEEYNKEVDYKGSSCIDLKDGLELKLDQNNTVNITSVKCTCKPTINTEGKVTKYPDPDCLSCKYIDITSVKEKMYSVNELIAALYNYREFAWKKGLSKKDLSDWIKENL